MSLDADMLAMGAHARTAARDLREASAATRNHGLEAAAQALRAHCAAILQANARDLAQAHAAGLSAPVIDRLCLDAARIAAMASGVEAIARQADPVGRELAGWSRPNGLSIRRITTPIGVIGVIYESRPNVTADAAALCIKSSNAAILRCGSEAFESARAIHAAFTEGLCAGGLPPKSVQLVEVRSRQAVGLMLQGLGGSIDLIVPRGGKSLTARVMAEARVPVLAHLEGLVHVYLHEGADLEKARALVRNAKMRRTGICGAAETLLIDRTILTTVGRAVLKELVAAGCEIRGDEAICTLLSEAVPAGEEDWQSEYLDAIISVRCVDGLEDAISHIEHYGSQHTDCIVTEDAMIAEEFLRRVDSAIVMWNASTQFADGGEFGMGAEIGIATGRLHARGPVGAEQLVTFKYVVRGDGQCRD
ncbi:MAG: glutamate-5-semialdehyde dehydrogenase [Alphaproteobacteria bacterium]|nr:glutamate-5-semialdehyde dehydrogenase [Alphaproteobacteria bacterium]